MSIEHMEPPKTDYFAERLLGALPYTDPIAAAYTAQAVSRDVGFDFETFQDVVPRALDEVRETKEAAQEDGLAGREHFGDEMADIMFSLVNLARHAGIEISDLPSMDAEALARYISSELQLEDSDAVVEGIADKIRSVAELEATASPDRFRESMLELFKSGVADVMALAHHHGFDASNLLELNVRKYLERCKQIESLAMANGKQWRDLAAEGAILDYWRAAKQQLG